MQWITAQHYQCIHFLRSLRCPPTSTTWKPSDSGSSLCSLLILLSIVVTTMPVVRICTGGPARTVRYQRFSDQNRNPNQRHSSSNPQAQEQQGEGDKQMHTRAMTVSSSLGT